MSENIGEKLKKTRKKQNLTISDLAKMTNLSAGYLSNVERGINSPTIESLRKIVNALSTTFIELFREQKKDKKIIRKSERIKLIKTTNDKVLYELLSPTEDKKMEAMLQTLQTGEGSGNRQYSHIGEEFCYVIKGKMVFTLGQKDYTLKEGDAIYFDSFIPHKNTNIGETECISIWVVTPPSF